MYIFKIFLYRAGSSRDYGVALCCGLMLHMWLTSLCPSPLDRIVQEKLQLYPYVSFVYEYCSVSQTVLDHFGFQTF